MLNKLMITTALTGLMIGGALAQNPTTQPMTPTQPQANQPAAQPMPGVNAAERAAQSSPSMGAGDAKFINAQATDQWLSSNFIGVDVVGPDNEKIGDVTDILFEKNGNVVGYVVGVGGFLGIGAKNVALAPTSFQVVADTDRAHHRIGRDHRGTRRRCQAEAEHDQGSVAAGGVVRVEARAGFQGALGRTAGARRHESPGPDNNGRANIIADRRPVDHSTGRFFVRRLQIYNPHDAHAYRLQRHVTNWAQRDTGKAMTSFEPDTMLVHEVVPSPNHGERAGNRLPDMILLHYTGMPEADKALAATVSRPTAKCPATISSPRTAASSRCVPEARRAWHAGEGSWAGETDINSCSIGIEIANPGHDDGYPDFPRRQIAAVTALCRAIMRHRYIRPERVLAHSDVAPGRKRDPGEKFPWMILHHAGVGQWAKPAPIVPGPSFEFGDSRRCDQELSRRCFAIMATASDRRLFRPDHA